MTASLAHVTAKTQYLLPCSICRAFQILTGQNWTLLIVAHSALLVLYSHYCRDVTSSLRLESSIPLKSDSNCVF